MKSETKALKLALAQVPNTWVRVWRNGSMWVGVTHNGWNVSKTLNDAEAALTAAGYTVERNGKPGTSGMNILDVKK